VELTTNSTCGEPGPVEANRGRRADRSPERIAAAVSAVTGRGRASRGGTSIEKHLEIDVGVEPPV